MMTAEDVRRFRQEMGVDMIEAQRKEQPWQRIVQDLAEWPTLAAVDYADDCGS